MKFLRPGLIVGGCLGLIILGLWGFGEKNRSENERAASGRDFDLAVAAAAGDVRRLERRRKLDGLIDREG